MNEEWRKDLGLLFVALLACAALLIILHPSKSESQQTRTEAYELRETLITPYLKRKIFPGKNLFYSSVFQLAWNKLQDDFTREPIDLEGNPIAKQLLNEHLIGPESISEGRYLVTAGFARDDIVSKTLFELKEKFNESLGTDITLSRPLAVLIYGFLRRDFKFAQEFEELPEPIMFKGATAVKAFGIKKYAEEFHFTLGEQAEIFDYKNDEHFIVRLRSSLDYDEVILAKLMSKKTLLGTIDYVLAQLEKKVPTPLHEADTLQIPVFDFDIVDRVIDVEGRRLKNRGLEDYFIDKAILSVRFKLSGAAAVSEHAYAEEEGVEVTEVEALKPRKLIFNDSFLLCVKEQIAKYPYLVIWVENADLLEKTNQ